MRRVSRECCENERSPLEQARGFSPLDNPVVQMPLSPYLHSHERSLILQTEPCIRGLAAYPSGFRAEYHTRRFGVPSDGEQAPGRFSNFSRHHSGRALLVFARAATL